MNNATVAVALSVNAAAILTAATIIWRGGRTLGEVMQALRDHNRRIERIEKIQDAKVISAD